MHKHLRISKDHRLLLCPSSSLSYAWRSRQPWESSPGPNVQLYTCLLAWCLTFLLSMISDYRLLEFYSWEQINITTEWWKNNLAPKQILTSRNFHLSELSKKHQLKKIFDFLPLWSTRNHMGQKPAAVTACAEVDSSLTFEDRTNLPDRGSPLPVVLSQSQFHVKQGHPSNKQKESVGNQEGSCQERMASLVLS